VSSLKRHTRALAQDLAAGPQRPAGLLHKQQICGQVVGDFYVTTSCAPSLPDLVKTPAA
jgi:hypothetical protein